MKKFAREFMVKKFISIIFLVIFGAILAGILWVNSLGNAEFSSISPSLRGDLSPKQSTILKFKENAEFLAEFGENLSENTKFTLSRDLNLSENAEFSAEFSENSSENAPPNCQIHEMQIPNSYLNLLSNLRLNDKNELEFSANLAQIFSVNFNMSEILRKFALNLMQKNATTKPYLKKQAVKMPNFWDFYRKDSLNLAEQNALNSLNAKSFFIKAPTKSAHASNLSFVNGEIMALFFAGEREGARDVAIWQSFLSENKQNKAFSPPKKLLTPEILSKMSGKFIKKLGNPLAFAHTQGKTQLFVVGVSLGGWATSKIYQLELTENFTPKFKQELHLSPFANFSHLVRNPPIFLQNGGFLLPIYHELATKYALLLEFDENANLRSKTRPNALKAQLQPSLIALNSHEALMFFRNHKQNAAFVQIYANNAWQSPKKSNLKNHDSSSVLFKSPNFVFLVHNDGAQNAVRSRLSLYSLNAKGEFIRLLTLDKGSEVSYPSVLMLKNELYISYTFERKFIKVLKLDINSLERLVK